MSVAVDRLYKKGLVSRVEDTQDRRIRIVSLTETGTALITPIYEAHVDAMNEVFSELKASELGTLEDLLRRVGQHAKKLRSAKLSTR